MNLLRSLFGGMLSAIWQTAKEYHYGKTDPPENHRQAPHETLHVPEAPGDDAVPVGPVPDPQGAAPDGPGPQEIRHARQVTPEHVVETLRRALPNLKRGDFLTLHHGRCIFPRGCTCIPVISAPLSRC